MLIRFFNEYHLLSEIGNFNAEEELSKMITNYYIKTVKLVFQLLGLSKLQVIIFLKMI